MWIIIIRLSCIITITTGILSQSIFIENENQLKYTIAAKALHGETKTKGSVVLKRYRKPYHIGTNAVKYKHSMLERPRTIHMDDAYRTPQGEISRHVLQHEKVDGIVNLDNVSSRLTNRQAPSHICQKLPLYVNFRDIGWNWIYSPAGFNAFVCQGECNNPLSESTAPLYAKVQALANETKASKSKPLCCVPTKTSSLVVEYFVGRNKHTLNMDDIIVEECGCR
ncbi:hypothetical protein ACJMK2_003054 [Sinanodonta woodiana]|uniref:TGF-beta family profile domain-containing protein n=1 Tax=Sinanodonta woodiana TaxID=1069815 RepID=A0ABD3XYX7_SINWO